MHSPKAEWEFCSKTVSISLIIAEAAGFISSLIFVMCEFYLTALRIYWADSSPTPFDLRFKVRNLYLEAINLASTSNDSCVKPHFYKSNSFNTVCPRLLMSASHKNLAHLTSIKLLSPSMSVCNVAFYLRPLAKLWIAFVEMPHLFILSVYRDSFCFRKSVKLSKCSW